MMTDIDPDAEILACAFCGRTMGRADAVADCWEPAFWATQTEMHADPCCPECSAEHLTDHGNDPIVKPGHEQFLRNVFNPLSGPPLTAEEMDELYSIPLGPTEAAGSFVFDDHEDGPDVS